MEIIDADGHVNERPFIDELMKFMPRGGQNPPLFPPFDHLHNYYLKVDGRSSGRITSKEWLDFMDQTGIEWTVVYPSIGLAVGRIVSVDWAIAACRAYNNWLHERFVNQSPRIKGMALIPLQDVEGAVRELHRAVKELGMCGAMLPSNGEGMKDHLGSKMYWPIYEEAEKLGCALAVHGGSHQHFGMDTFSVYYPAHALGHPFGIMVQAAGMLSHGIFERFPKLRVAFLEGGATWVPFFMDRLDRSYDSHAQVDLEGKYLVKPRPGHRESEYFRSLIQGGRIFVGFDCDDRGLGYAVQRAGREAFLFASDFPHESFNAESCRREIDEVLVREDLGPKDKEAVLGQNAKRLYGVNA